MKCYEGSGLIYTKREKREKKTGGNGRVWRASQWAQVEREHNRRESKRMRGTAGKSRREEIKPRAPPARAANGGSRPCTTPAAGSRGCKRH